MSKKILIIEDDKVLSEMYGTKFKIEGFQVEYAFDGFDGLVKIQSFQPDVILLDIMMPGMNGFDTIKVIKEQSSYNSKIIMFTNINNQSDIQKAFEMGADDYLLKADTTPKQAVERVLSILNNEEKIEVEEKYLELGINKFKLKNPSGGNDIDIEIKIG